MKKILFLLLSTIAMYGQVPADATPLENIQITNNITDNSATKVNVQSTDGTINTISKSDLVNVVEVNDVPTLPLVGEVGKIYVVKNVNKIYRWNGTFCQELAGSDISGLQAQIDLKAPLASPSLTGTPTAPTAPAGTNTTQIATTAFVAGGLATKENAFTKNTAFNKNFGTTAGTVVEGGTLGSNAYTSTAYLPLSGGDLSGPLKITRVGYQLSLTGSDQGAIDLYKSGTLGHRLFSDTSDFGIYDLAANVTIFSISKSTGAANFSSSVTATSFNGSATLTGTPTAPTAPAGTNTTQIATTAFVLENSSARPYKVYTALLSQSGTNAPTATVLENTLGGTVVWTRTSAGVYYATLAGSFTANKTFVSSSNRYIGFTPIYRLDSNIISLATSVTGSTYVDNVLENNSIEIRVYN